MQSKNPYERAVQRQEDISSLRRFLSDPQAAQANPKLRLSAWQTLKAHRGHSLDYLRVTKQQRDAGLYGSLAQALARGVRS